MRKWAARTMALVWLAGAALAVQAQNAIRSITSSQQAGAEVVRIELSEPLAAVPPGFVVQTPPRIAIDLQGVGNALGRSSVEINQGSLRSVNVAQSGERTRLVLNLKAPSNYRAQLDGKALIIVIESASGTTAAAVGEPAPAAASSPATAAAPAPAPGAVRFAEPLNASPLALRDIDFRRGPDGAGRVVVELPNNQVGVDIKQQGQSLVVEFLRSTLPAHLRRRLDVTDFGTPVASISAVQSGDRVRLSVEPRGEWQHSAYQSDNQFVLEVRPQRPDPNKLVQGPGYAGEKLSLNFQNIEVRALLQVIADFTNFNVVTSDSVTGNVTLRLKDVPWDQALDIILQAKSLGMRKNGNVILIAPKEELAAREKLELEAKAQIASLEPLRTQSFQLNYTRADEIARSLAGTAAGGGPAAAAAAAAVFRPACRAPAAAPPARSTRMLSPRGSVLFETRTNQIFVTDIPSKLEEVQAIIAKIDIPVRQVLIEARIVIANDTFGRSLGVRLGASDLRGVRGGLPGYSIGGDNRVTIGGNINAVGGQTLQTAGGVTYTDTQFVNLPASGQNNFDPATFAISLFGAAANRFLNLEISALEADGKGKVVSSPRVITSDSVKALIEQGEELPYQVATSSGATALQFRKANLKLEVTPRITPEGNVSLDVDVNKDSVGRNTAAGLAIDTKHVRTQVLVESGGTVVIGGIYEQNDREDITKVPFLGDVPVVGNLFKTRTRTASKTELLIFITPKVVTERTAVR